MDIDEKLFRNDDHHYLKMIQHQQPDEKGRYILEFSCGSFRDEVEHDKWRCAENYFYTPVLTTRTNCSEINVQLKSKLPTIIEI